MGNEPQSPLRFPIAPPAQGEPERILNRGEQMASEMTKCAHPPCKLHGKVREVSQRSV
jgi:hypothetical protein